MGPSEIYNCSCCKSQRKYPSKGFYYGNPPDRSDLSKRYFGFAHIDTIVYGGVLEVVLGGEKDSLAVLDQDHQSVAINSIKTSAKLPSTSSNNSFVFNTEVDLETEMCPIV